MTTEAHETGGTGTGDAAMPTAAPGTRGHALPELGDWDGPIFGTLGVLAIDGDRVECHCCGRWYKFLASHVVQTHGLLADEYRAIFGLNRSTALAGPATKAAKRAAALPRLQQYWGKSPFMTATSEERSAWRQGQPWRLEGRSDPDNHAVWQRHAAETSERLRGRRDADAPIMKAAARQRELRQDPAYRERLRQRNSEAQGGRVLATCPICGTTVAVPPSRLRAQQHVYCSPACRREYQQRRGRETAAHMRALAQLPVALVCAVCGHAFTGPKHQQYCSRPCANRAFNHRTAGQCAACGRVFLGARRRQYCSIRCAARTRDRDRVATHLQALDPTGWGCVTAEARQLVERYYGLGVGPPWTKQELAACSGRTPRWVIATVRDSVARLLGEDAMGHSRVVAAQGEVTAE